MVSYAAFSDELVKIASGKAMTGMVGKALSAAGRRPGAAMLLSAGGALMGAGQLKKMKRRYSIGKQIEKQQREAQRAARRRR
jgi:hypothetical protein